MLFALKSHSSQTWTQFCSIFSPQQQMYCISRSKPKLESQFRNILVRFGSEMAMRTERTVKRVNIIACASCQPNPRYPILPYSGLPYPTLPSYGLCVSPVGSVVLLWLYIMRKRFNRAVPVKSIPNSYTLWHPVVSTSVERCWALSSQA